MWFRFFCVAQDGCKGRHLLCMVLKVIDLSLSAFQGVYVPAGTPPTQPVPMPVIPQQPDVILRQEMAVAPGAN